jgi:TPR repeat protein
MNNTITTTAPGATNAIENLITAGKSKMAAVRAIFHAADLHEATALFTQAAHAESPEAYYQLGKWQEEEAAKKPDDDLTKRQGFVRAYLYYEAAAQRGSAPGMYRLALGHLQGDYVSLDPFAAFALLQASASGGCTKAMHKLAECFEAGTITEPDLELALHWYTSAAANGHPEALAAKHRLSQNLPT